MSNETLGRWQPDGKMLALQLVSLLVVLAIIPLFEPHVADHAALFALFAGLTTIFLIGLIVIRRYRVVLLSGLVIVALALPMMWVTLYVDRVDLFVGSCVLGGVFFGMTAVATMWGVHNWYTATVHSIYGAVSAYLLLGLAWAMFYWGLDLADGGALDIPYRRTLTATIGGKELTSFSQMVYFSFVCMSSLGFGDISPTTQVAETLCWSQAVVGQFYLAVLVARLVGAIPVVRKIVRDRR